MQRSSARAPSASSSDSALASISRSAISTAIVPIGPARPRPEGRCAAPLFATAADPAGSGSSAPWGLDGAPGASANSPRPASFSSPACRRFVRPSSTTSSAAQASCITLPSILAPRGRQARLCSRPALIEAPLGVESSSAVMDSSASSSCSATRHSSCTQSAGGSALTFVAQVSTSPGSGRGPRGCGRQCPRHRARPPPPAPSRSATPALPWPL